MFGWTCELWIKVVSEAIGLQLERSERIDISLFLCGIRAAG
jgi:hypothetical protein